MVVCVKLKAIKDVEIKGELKRFHPGDWVHVGRQTAERWIAQGEAWQPSGEITVPSGAGVWVRGLAVPGCKVLEALPYVEDDGNNMLPYPKTLVWDPALGCRHELLGVGFHLLKRWQVAAPLLSYEVLACHLGDDEDRARTEAVIRDLRVPVYDTRMMFVRRCIETVELVTRWLEDGDGDERLALLRAIYTVKPVICALPASWAGN